MRTGNIVRTAWEALEEARVEAIAGLGLRGATMREAARRARVDLRAKRWREICRAAPSMFKADDEDDAR